MSLFTDFTNTSALYIQQHSASSYLYKKQAIMEFFFSGKRWHPPLYPCENNLTKLMCAWVSIAFLTQMQEKFYWKVVRKPCNTLKKKKITKPEIYTKRQFEKQHNLSIAIPFKAKPKYSLRSGRKDVEGRAGE